MASLQVAPSPTAGAVGPVGFLGNGTKHHIKFVTHVLKVFYYYYFFFLSVSGF